MKNTFLVFNDQTKPESGLRVATASEWDQILKSNQTLPREQRRFFICDSFEDCREIDRMFIETTKDEYDKWHAKYADMCKKRKIESSYAVVSLSEDIGEDLTIEDTLPAEFDLENAVCDSVLLEELRNALSNWKDWANEMLDYYMAGKYSACSKEMIEKYGLSYTTIAKRKKQFSDFVKNFLKKGFRFF